MQRLLVVMQVELTGKGAGRTIGGNLVMLDLLGRGDEPGIASIFSFSCTSVSMLWSVCSVGLAPCFSSIDSSLAVWAPVSSRWRVRSSFSLG